MMASALPSSTHLPLTDVSGKIEDYPPGYPRFASLTGSHSSFFVFRRFSTLRARMLLHKQDIISQLEEDLERLDQNEPKVLFHGSRRRDTNSERHALLSQLETTMAEFDDLLARTRHALTSKAAPFRDINNVRDWIGHFGCISRDESRYLWKDDLITVAPSDSEDFLDSVAGLGEDFIIWLSKLLNKDFRTSRSRDPNLHIFPETLIKTVSRAILAVAASTILLIPIVIISLVEAQAVRLVLVVLANAMFVTVLSLLVRQRVGEVFVAGATYAAVLVVYVGGTSN